LHDLIDIVKIVKIVSYQNLEVNKKNGKSDEAGCKAAPAKNWIFYNVQYLVDHYTFLEEW